MAVLVVIAYNVAVAVVGALLVVGVALLPAPFTDDAIINGIFSLAAVAVGVIVGWQGWHFARRLGLPGYC